MTPMKFFVRITFLAGLVVGLAGLPAMAQTGQQGQKPQSTAPQASGQAPAAGQKAPTGPVAKTPAEEKAYTAFYKLSGSDPKAIISSGNSFVQKFPASEYNSEVYARMTNAYREMGNEDKMFEMADKALKLNPNNVDVLSLMAYSIPRRIDPNNLDSRQKLAQAEIYANRALSLIPTMPKPTNLTDEQFTTAKNAELSSCHSGLGLVDFYQHNLTGMITELEQAVKLDPTPDPTDQFLLGFAYVQAKRYTDAVTPLEACSKNPEMASRCKSLLDQVKKHAMVP
jgi:tetratricopeptide (TPR) repeat protein